MILGMEWDDAPCDFRNSMAEYSKKAKRGCRQQCPTLMAPDRLSARHRWFCSDDGLALVRCSSSTLFFFLPCIMYDLYSTTGLPQYRKSQQYGWCLPCIMYDLYRTTAVQQDASLTVVQQHRSFSSTEVTTLLYDNRYLNGMMGRGVGTTAAVTH